ncbi:uncharacterized protein MJAP1_001270 [Malassezia japonica]|uniref:Uncharacterized protein n=1 Tax=Malassezia japonica TaxID=223818 RepID=A0AAF0F012_9BASI|nr:uncharacterized protein MJAP1_001270 [Malassezia japonica]WFD38319.1 hypothetical protein MJAP1_001270 [Malassezia japonica]
MAGRRPSTPWDAAALRWSTLYGHDSLPSHMHISSLRAVYGVRNIPVDLGRAADLELDDQAPVHDDARKRGAPTELSFQTMALRQDTMPREGVLSDSRTTALRKRQRVVDGALERASPYWGQRQSRGPMRARIPLVGRDLERLFAASQRTTSTRMDKGPNRRAMALQARHARGEDREDVPGSDLGDAHADAPDEASLFPLTFPWTEQDEETYWHNEFGWVYAADRDEHIPEASFLVALHYYTAKYYETQGLLPPPAGPPDAAACEALRRESQEAEARASATEAEAEPSARGARSAAPEHDAALAHEPHVDANDIIEAAAIGSPLEAAPETSGPGMDAGDPLWHQWAAHSIGRGRSMAHALDASALLGLATLVEQYTRHGAPRPLRRNSRVSDAALSDALRAERPRKRRASARAPCEIIEPLQNKEV